MTEEETHAAHRVPTWVLIAYAVSSMATLACTLF